MASFETLEKISSSFPEVTIEPHFEKISFRIRSKIFATYDQEQDAVTVKLSATNQNIFTSACPDIAPVDNKWGKQGWTSCELGRIDQRLLKDILTSAYCEIAPKKFSKLIKD